MNEYGDQVDTDEQYDVRTLADLKELIDRLDEDGYNLEDIKVRFASQPSWPLAYGIDRAVLQHDEEDELELWLVEDRQIGYLPGPVKEKIGW